MAAVFDIPSNNLPAILFVTHNIGGGIEKHVRDLGRLFSDRVNVLLLHPSPFRRNVELFWQNDISNKIYFKLDYDYWNLITLLRELNIQRIHYHHLLGLPLSVWHISNDLGVAYDFTLHDYYSICPQVHLMDVQGRYCGEEGKSQCTTCLKIRPAPYKLNIQSWRNRFSDIIVNADRVFAPSHDVAMRFRRYFLQCNLVVAHHPEMENIISRAVNPHPLTGSESLRIAVLGTLTKMKGAALLESCATHTKKNRLPLQFDLIGEPYKRMPSLPDNLIIHGRYCDDDLPKFLSELKPHLVWFPALCPETYSYTLSACISAGLPVVCPDIGAFPERVAGRPWSWVVPWDLTTEQFSLLFVKIRAEHFLPNISPEMSESTTIAQAAFYYVNDYLRPSSKNAVVQSVFKTRELVSLIATHNQSKQTMVDRIYNCYARLVSCLMLKVRNSCFFQWLAMRIPDRMREQIKIILRGNQ